MSTGEIGGLADVIQLPTAAKDPPPNKRHHGPYPRAIPYLRNYRFRRYQEQQRAEQERRPLTDAARDQETKELLKDLAVLVEHEGGSVIVIYRRPDGHERVGRTGVYKADNDTAQKVLRVAWNTIKAKDNDA